MRRSVYIGVVIGFAQLMLCTICFCGICNYKAQDGSTAEYLEYTDCQTYATTNCRQKCVDLNFDKSYSCKLAQGSKPDCVLQCTCRYFSPDYKEITPPLPPWVPPPIEVPLAKPFNECLLFGTSCSTICKNATQYCQVALPLGPKSCVCHHWIKGNTLIGAYNDFLSIGESLYSNNGLYQLTVSNYYRMDVIKVSTSEVLAYAYTTNSVKTGDRFTLKNNGTIVIQTAGVDFNGKIFQVVNAEFIQFEKSAFLRIEDCGYAIFYNKDMRRIKILGWQFSLTYQLCKDVNVPEQ